MKSRPWGKRSARTAISSDSLSALMQHVPNRQHVPPTALLRIIALEQNSAGYISDVAVTQQPVRCRMQLVASMMCMMLFDHAPYVRDDRPLPQP